MPSFWSARSPIIKSMGRTWGLATILAALAAAGAWYAGYPIFSPVHQTAPTINAKAPVEAPAPVRVATVQKHNFPIYLNGLGTVQAANNVTVRSRVDGQIMQVGFVEGQMLKEGDLLVQLDPAPYKAALDQAVAKLAQDTANLTSAKLDLQRTTTLVKQGDATRQLFDQQTANVAQLTAQLEADNAAIASAKVQLAYTTIKSPLTGRAGFRLVDPGNIVHANDQSGVLTITQVQPISVIFTAPEQQLPTIAEALKNGPLQITAYTSDGKAKLGEGTLNLIDNQVDTATGTLRLKASLPNLDNALWPGLSVSTRLLVSTTKNVVVVPDTAVQRGPNGLYVYVVGGDRRAELRNVKVGPIAGGQALIEAGLSQGEQIITSGHYRVVPGGAVQILDDVEQPQRNAD